jgi:hypothetical protein
LSAKTGGTVGRGAVGEVAETLVKRGIHAVSEGVSKAVADFHRGTAKGLEDVAKRTKQVDATAEQSFNKLARGHPVPRPRGGGVTADLSHADRGDGRDPGGRFTGAGGYGKSDEARGLAQYQNLTGRPVIGKQIRVTTGKGGTRLYDGLSLKSDGTYEGVEVKSGSASRDANQRAFDARVSAGTPATGMLNGKLITVTSVWLMRVSK